MAEPAESDTPKKSQRDRPRQSLLATHSSALKAEPVANLLTQASPMR